MVVVHFPFSDLSQAKRRPALVLAVLQGDDVILCQITSQTVFDKYSIALEVSDFAAGGLNRPSRIRPNRLFTADSHIVQSKAGAVLARKLAEAPRQLASILGSSNGV